LRAAEEGGFHRFVANVLAENVTVQRLPRPDRPLAAFVFRRLESMTIQRATDEDDIRHRINRWLEALRAMDLEGVMSLYAPDIVSFDIVPPLRHVGAKAKEKNWMDAFAIYQRPLGYEIRDLTLTLGDDVAFGHSLNRVSGTLKNGNKTDVWLRWTGCFRKIDGNWLIAHDQVSVPTDPESGRALLNLEP
jgi:uncharacterized protein (TIGR02246 family)